MTKKQFMKKLNPEGKQASYGAGLPGKPGVYFFMKGGQILYIGKATSLSDRTKSYFAKDLIATRGPLIVDMIFKADKIKYEIADSVLEALILEANLIKKHQPYYNTREKDDKSFLCVVITKEAIPRVLTMRARNLKEHSDILKNVRISKVYGPFTNGSQLKEALKIIRRIFPFLDEKSKNYLEFYRQINLAPDPNDRKLYIQNIRNIKLFFSGKKKQILQNLKKEMKVYAKAREFERAGEVKRQIFALNHINDVALLKNDSAEQENFHRSSLPGVPGGSHTSGNFPALPFRIEAYDVAHMGGKNMVGVMTVVEDGRPDKNEYRKFKIRTQTNANDTGALGEIIERRLGHPEWNYPKLIVVDGSTAQINTVKGILSIYGIKIPVVSVVKNDRHKPIGIKGEADMSIKYEKEILLANSEAHRFAITFHKLRRGKSFLP